MRRLMKIYNTASGAAFVALNAFLWVDSTHRRLCIHYINGGDYGNYATSIGAQRSASHEYVVKWFKRCLWHPLCASARSIPVSSLVLAVGCNDNLPCWVTSTIRTDGAVVTQRERTSTTTVNWTAHIGVYEPGGWGEGCSPQDSGKTIIFGQKLNFSGWASNQK